MKPIAVLIIITGWSFTNCQKPTDPETDNQTLSIQQISFGTRFGMCAGYCKQQLTFTDSEVTKTITPQVDEKLSEKTCSQSYSLADVASNIDVEAFFNLPEIIGCPDCADGGAEWIELTTDKLTKKVTYEFGEEPIEVQSFIESLRKVYDQLGNCE